MFSTLFPASLQKRVVLFLLRRAMGQFLDRDLDAENMDVQLGKGQVVLRDLGLNLPVINNMLEVNKIPVVLSFGCIKEISVNVPWNNLWSGQCSISVKGLKVDVKINEDFHVPLESTSQILSSSIHFAGDFLRNQNTEIGASETLPIAAENDGVKTIASLMERIISAATVSVEDIAVRIILEDETGAEAFSVKLSCEQLEVKDGASEAEDNVGNEEDDSGNLILGYLKKTVVCTGLKMKTCDLQQHQKRTVAESSDTNISKLELLQDNTILSFFDTPVTVDITFNEIAESRPLFMTATESLFEDPYAPGGKSWGTPRLQVCISSPPMLVVLSKQDIGILSLFAENLDLIRQRNSRGDDISDNDSDGNHLQNSSFYDDNFQTQDTAKAKGMRLTVSLKTLCAVLIDESGGLSHEKRMEGSKPAVCRELPTDLSPPHFRLDVFDMFVQSNVLDTEFAAELKLSRLQILLSNPALGSVISKPDLRYSPLVIISDRLSRLEEKGHPDKMSSNFKEILFTKPSSSEPIHRILATGLNTRSSKLSFEVNTLITFVEISTLEMASVMMKKHQKTEAAGPPFVIAVKVKSINLFVLSPGTVSWKMYNSAVLWVSVERLQAETNLSKWTSEPCDDIDKTRLTLGFKTLKVCVSKQWHGDDLDGKAFLKVYGESQENSNNWNVRLSSLATDGHDSPYIRSIYDGADDENSGYGFQSWYDIGGAAAARQPLIDDEKLDLPHGGSQIVEVDFPTAQVSLVKDDFDELLLFANRFSQLNSKNRTTLKPSESIDAGSAENVHTLKFRLGEGNITLKSTLNSWSYELILAELNVLLGNSASKGQSQIRGSCGSLSFSDISRSLALLQTSEERKRNSGNELIKETNVTVSLNDLIVDAPRDSPIAEDLASFFKMPNEMIYVDDVERLTKTSVSLEDCQLVHKTKNGQFAVFLGLEKSKMTVDLYPDGASTNAKVSVQKAFVRLLDMRIAQLEAQLDISLKTAVGILISDRLITIETCADTFQSLIAFFSSLSEQKEKFAETDSNPVFLKSGKSNKINMDALGEIFDTDESAPSSPVKASPAAGQKNERFLPGDVIFAYDPVDSFHIQMDTSHSDQPTFRFIAQDFDVVWKLYDGLDWTARDQGDDADIFEMPARSRSPDSKDASLGEGDYENISESSLQEDDEIPLGKDANEEYKPKAKKISKESQGRRSREPAMEFRAFGIFIDVKILSVTSDRASKMLFLVRDFDIIDNIRTSTWRKFLSHMRPDSDDQPREKKSDMIRFELLKVRPNPSQIHLEETRLKVRLLPLRLHVDQDALTSLIRFFSYTLPIEQIEAENTSSASSDSTFFQLCEIHPISVKIDYKPKQIDYTNLKDGNLIEILNFFHLDGAEMTLRDIRMTGVKGWARLSEALLREWLPHIRNTQVPRVVSGVSGVKALVNLGAGIANLILIPIDQYRKDGRIIKGIQKGMKSFAWNAGLLLGRKWLLEHADEILSDDVRAEEDETFAISKFLGLYSMRKKYWGARREQYFAVPMEVYEKTSAQGNCKSCYSALCLFAVLKPMIGATEAVSKTLIGLQNTLDPNKRLQMEDKYKG
ncbi:hypothetical protein BC829DRAFT_392668 [Chytridium lagenaria]|nr:hypothetical protein BC829DRAFT_392668 [Chytridium lagenaria]